MTKRKRRGSSKAGRPRKEGARYPSGKLKPAGPNERVLDKRRAGDAEAGEHPLDFALSKHWITEQMHRDATAYRVAFNRSHIGATAPRLGLASLPEVEPSEALRMKWGEMPDGEIAGIWDAVFGEDAVANAAVMEEGALAAWRLLNSSLSPAEREELFKVSILGSWPLWMVKMASDNPLGRQDQARMEALFGGLSGVARFRRPQKGAPERISAVPHRPDRAGRSEASVRYVDEQGVEVGARDKHGRRFEVAVLRRR